MVRAASDQRLTRRRPGLTGRPRARGAAVLAVLVLGPLAASFSYNLATDGPAGRPAVLTVVRAGGFGTRYLAWGARGSTVLLVPGAFETADTFAALGRRLGRTHRVFAIDLTGTGYSVPSPPFDAGHLAGQVLAFIRAMHLTGARRPVLVGHSSGAAVVGMAALRDPRAVAGVVFLDGDATPLAVPALPGRLLINPFRTTLVRLVLSSGWLISQIYQSQCGPACPPLSAAGLRTWRRPLEQPGFLQVVAYNMAHGIPSMSPAQLRRLRAMAVPKLVVYGKDDPQMSRSAAVAAAARIGAPRPVAIPGRHLTMISSPGQLAAAVDRFALAARNG